MIRLLCVSLLVTVSVISIISSSPVEFKYWPASDLGRTAKSLAPKVNADKIASEQLGTFDNHRVMMIHRQGNGLAELHETETDFYVIQDGTGTLVTGGEIVDPKTTGPGEIRGPSIRGGQKVQLKPGDVANIPSKTPHQVLVQQGKSISYLIVKIRDR